MPGAEPNRLVAAGALAALQSGWPIITAARRSLTVLRAKLDMHEVTSHRRRVSSHLLVALAVLTVVRKKPGSGR